MKQMSLFNAPTYKIDKPIRLIELFAGIGAQAKALERLNANFEHYRICEFDKFAVNSYNAIHGTHFEPSDITQITADDLDIVDTDKYCYIMTYSFPCQDLSLAGLQKGFAAGSGTRSSLLWQVKRLLQECRSLPQVLIMENVTQVHNKKNKHIFMQWLQFLESKGYSNYWRDLNSKDFGVPQNRNRCFMVSILGDYDYSFPVGFPLTERLKDRLEDTVDEKYYITDAQLKYMLKTTFTQSKYNSRVRSAFSVSGTKSARDAKAPQCVEVGYLSGGKYDKMHSISRRVYSSSGVSATASMQCGGNTKMKILVADTDISRTIRVGGRRSLDKKHSFDVVCDKNSYVRECTPLEYWRLMDFDDTDFEKATKVNSPTQLYKQAGNSIVVAVLYYIFKEML